MKRSNVCRLLRVDYVDKDTYYQLENAEYVFFDMIRVSKWVPVEKFSDLKDACEHWEMLDRQEYNRTRPNPTISVVSNSYFC